MARLPLVSAEDLEPEDRPLLARPINLFRVLATSPGALRAHHRFGEWIRFECELDKRWRELVILQVGYVTDSPYEWSHHVEIGKQFGVTDADIRRLVAESNGETTDLGLPERALLRATRQLTAEAKIDPGIWAEVAQFLSPARLTDFVVIASFYSHTVRVLAALEVDVEPDYQNYLSEFPLRLSS